jgi:catechol 2,3-dioxygenase-like lactoylglutathione lyase family enzyme
MLRSSALVGFVRVTDLDRAKRFYGEALGLVLHDESPYALVADVAGAMLRITAVDKPSAAPYTVLGWAVVRVLDTAGPAAAVPTTSVGHQHCRQPRPAAIRREEQSSRGAPREG